MGALRDLPRERIATAFIAAAASGLLDAATELVGRGRLSQAVLTAALTHATEGGHANMLPLLRYHGADFVSPIQMTEVHEHIMTLPPVIDKIGCISEPSLR